jgi:dGTPase
VYLVEAADDICYSIMDLEDAHRLGIFPTQKVAELLLNLIKAGAPAEGEKIETTYNQLADDANEGINYLRAKAINQLVRRCAAIFLSNNEALLNGKFEGDLLGQASEIQAALSRIQSESVRHIYNHPSVVRIELAGYNIMHGLVGDLVEAALLDAGQRDAMARKRIFLIPAQYVFEETDSAYEKVMCILDFVSGMTDSYALKLYRNLRGIEIPSI